MRETIEQYFRDNPRLAWHLVLSSLWDALAPWLWATLLIVALAMLQGLDQLMGG